MMKRGNASNSFAAFAWETEGSGLISPSTWTFNGREVQKNGSNATVGVLSVRHFHRLFYA
jgi:hypothetical protein